MTSGLDDAKMRVNLLLGHVETRTWLEAETVQDGQLRLVGMASLTNFDREGKIIKHEVTPTGLILLWQAQNPRRVSWWRKLLGDLL